MQPTPPLPTRGTATTLITTYGPFILSFLAILLIALAWLLHDLDTPTALGAIGAILGANGLVGAAQWQAASGLLPDLQQIIGQLTSHIQAMHAQQLAASAASAIAPLQIAPGTLEVQVSKEAIPAKTTP